MNNIFVLVGFPGSGKSTYTNILRDSMKDVVVHSSDEIRRELYGSDEETGASEEVFNLLHRRMIIDLQCGKDVIYDAMNLEKEKRVNILDIVSTHCPHVKKTALFLDTEIGDCKKANEARQRVVPDCVYDQMQSSFSVPVLEEGFDQIITVKQKRMIGFSDSTILSLQAPNPDDIEVIGVFFDKDEVYSHAASAYGERRLNQMVQYPHVTFKYMPSNIHKDLFGKRASFTVVGYGNDGLNEGLLVQWHEGEPEIQVLFEQIKIPHITLSYGAYGSAVNTRYLEFEHTKPFVIEGIFGGVTYGGELIKDAGELLTGFSKSQ